MPILGVIDSAKTGRLASLPNSLKFIGTPNMTNQGSQMQFMSYLNGEYVAVVNGYSLNGTSSFDNLQYVASSSDGITWTFKGFPDQGSGTIYSMVWTGTHYVAPGFNAGEIRYSTDLINWSTKNTGAASTFYVVTYGGGGIVAIPVDGSAGRYIASSNPTGTWSNTAAMSGPGAINIVSLYQNGRWFYATNNGVYYTTTLAHSSYTISTSTSSLTITGLAGDGTNKLVAIDNAGNALYSSNNGTSFTSSTPTGLVDITGATINNAYNVSFDGNAGQWVVSSLNGPYIWVSTNGSTWTLKDTGCTYSYGDQARGVTISPAGRYVIQYMSFGAYSTDAGNTWTPTNTTGYQIANAQYLQQGYTGGCYGNGIFLTNPRNGYRFASKSTDTAKRAETIAYSTNKGITWNIASATLPTANFSWSWSIYHNNKFYVGMSGSLDIVSSTNAITWTNSTMIKTGTPSFSQIRTAPATNGSTVVLGTTNSAGGVWYSTDNLVNVVFAPLSNCSRIYSVVYSSSLNRFVATGWTTTSSQFGIWYSTDGISWTQASVAVSTTGLNNIAWSSKANLFVAITGSGLNYQTSTNGISWTARTFTNPLIATVYDVFGDANGFILKDNQSQYVFKSTDGLTWTTLNTNGATNCFANSTIKEGVNPSGIGPSTISDGISAYVIGSGGISSLQING